MSITTESTLLIKYLSVKYQGGPKSLQRVDFNKFWCKNLQSLQSFYAFSIVCIFHELCELSNSLAIRDAAIIL